MNEVAVLPSDWAMPRTSMRWFSVWRRNFLVWKKAIGERMIGNIAEPVITLVAFGYGLGSLLPTIDGLPYILFLASGSVCVSTMQSAKFESLWGAFSRMHVQKTWDAILNAPMSVDDVLLGELLWAASKASFTGLCILGVIVVLGISRAPTMLLVLPLLLVIGATFSAMALVCNAIARGYDFFTYYFTLVVTPMIFLSGVFYPVRALPPWLQLIAQMLPLSAAVRMIRPLVIGTLPSNVLRDLAIMAVYWALSFYAATVLTRRRMSK
jgi:lipooligosaccharide transport system permease protein